MVEESIDDSVIIGLDWLTLVSLIRFYNLCGFIVNVPFTMEVDEQILNTASACMLSHWSSLVHLEKKIGIV
jgi:hypothetical protein